MAVFEHLITFILLCETIFCDVVVENLAVDELERISDCQSREDPNDWQKNIKHSATDESTLSVENFIDQQTEHSHETNEKGGRNGRRLIFTRSNCLPGFHADGRGRCREIQNFF